MSDIVKDFVKALKSEKKTSAYDTTAVVTRVEDDVAWVHIAGGVDETPVRLTINAKAGDNVQVRVSGGRAWLTGNMSAPPTDNEMAQRALDYGKIANDAAQKAVADAQVANEAASSAKRSADEAQRTAESVEGIARHAEETAESVEGIAEQARTDAGIAKSAADKAVKDLSQVENVVGVVNWIAEHGEMISQAGGTFDPAKVYFIVDPNGDYHIGNTHYSVVQNPREEDIDSYYILNIDESVQNYVMTHLYVDSEGLWLIPEDNATPQSSSKKILIAVGGQGHTYSVAGTYIIEKVNDVDRILAAFISNGVNIYNNGELCAHFGNEVTIGKEHVADRFVTTINENGFEISRWLETTTVRQLFAVVHNAQTNKDFVCIGTRPSNANYGTRSVSMGHFAKDSSGPLGYVSVTMNLDTKASGQASFAQGEYSIASGRASVAMNNHTSANYDSQTAIGNYNDNKTNNAFEIGNGTYDSRTSTENRSNAFEVGWDGNVKMALNTNATSGVDKEIYDALVELGWDSDVID